MRAITFCGIFCTLFLCTFAIGVLNFLEYKMTIEATNMPAVWQVDAADALETAYELETNAYMRLKMFSELFYSKHSASTWIAVLNYEEIYYTGDSFIRFKVDNDTVLLFTGTPTAPPPGGNEEGDGQGSENEGGESEGGDTGAGEPEGGETGGGEIEGGEPEGESVA